MQRLLRAFALFALAGCGKHEATPSPANTSAPTATSSAEPPASSGAMPSALASAGGTLVPAPSGACRVLAVSGQANVEGVAVTLGALLDGEHWVELEPGAAISLRHTLTSRELKLVGPGRALPCRDGGEQFLLARGTLATFSTLGVRPGAEVLLATPAGTVHYGDADLSLEYGARGLLLRVRAGAAWLEPGEPSAKPIKNPISGSKELRLPPPHRDPKELATACQAAAETAAASAERLLGGSPPSPSDSLGARAAAQMRDRSAARAACAIAASATGSLADPAERQSLWASIAHSDELWRSVPRVSARKN